MGRPTDYDQARHCQQAFELCQGGATDFEIYEALGIGRATLYRWKGEHPEFAQAMKLGKELPDDRVEASLYHRAVGYTYHAIKIVTIDGAPCSVAYLEHVPPDPSAAMHWLANRRKDDWKHRQTTQHVGPNDGPIETVAEVRITPERAAADYLAIVKGEAPST